MKWWMWLGKEDAFTVGLIFSGFFVAFGCVVVVLFTWVGLAMNGYDDLMHVAEHVSFAGESQATAMATISPGGFVTMGWHLDEVRVQSATNQMWNVERSHLSPHFTQLSEDTELDGNDIVVTIHGDYLPGPLARLSAVWPKLVSVAKIPMAATAKQAYFVPG